MQATRTRLTEGGRIVIPAEFRKALGLCVGDKVVLVLEGQEIRLMSTHESTRQIQEVVHRYVPEGVSLVDELIAERRAEAARE